MTFYGALEYLPEIKAGDKRVFLINGKVCGAISRIPKKAPNRSDLNNLFTLQCYGLVYILICSSPSPPLRLTPLGAE